jgi:hypothetical protein
MTLSVRPSNVVDDQPWDTVDHVAPPFEDPSIQYWRAEHAEFPE